MAIEPASGDGQHITNPSTEEENVATAHKRMATLHRKRMKSRKRKIIITALILLTFIAGLYIGAGKYRDSANRAACFVNQSSIKKAYDSYQGVASGEDTQIGTIKELWNNFESAHPTCPSGGTYVIGSSPEAIYSGEEPHVRCSHKHHEYQRFVNRQKELQDRTNK